MIFLLENAVSNDEIHVLSRKSASRGYLGSASRWWVLIGFWFFLPILMLNLTELANHRPLQVPSVTEVLYLAAVWLPWAPLTVLISTLGRRFPVVGQGAAPRLVLHLVISWIVAFSVGLVSASSMTLLPPLVPSVTELEPSVTEKVELVITSSLMIFQGLGALSQILYWLILVSCSVRDVVLQNRHRRALAAEARLASLEAQLQPHFLFNTLNTISVLMEEDVAKARSMIEQLSELLRANLRRQADHEVMLADELELVGTYLDIERVRFEDRLQVRLDISQDLHRVLVPRLILQPLVENAIKHGVSLASTAGVITLDAQAVGRHLMLAVHDDGPGLSAAATEGGVGLANVRGRLEELYGAEGSLEIRANEPRGTSVEIRLPLRRADGDD